MPDQPSTDLRLLHTGIATLFPDKTALFSRVFNNTTNSYKLLWLVAILTLAKRNSSSTFSFNSIFVEMAVAAWAPVCLYRLSLGRQDKLQNIVLDLQAQSGLLPHATEGSVREYIENSSIAKEKLQFLRRYVPTRFLMPWFAEHINGAQTHKDREQLVMKLALQSQTTRLPSPYYFEDSNIRLNDSWHAFFLENMGIVEAFTEHHLACYLQARNPNAPGIVNKLRAPGQRDLTVARGFWTTVRAAFQCSGVVNHFQDIYSGRHLGGNFSIDHFLPWSFVVHDLIWNLLPVEASTNSSKSDTLPDFELYVPRLAKLHFNVLQAVKVRPRILEEYVDCFKQEQVTILALGVDEFVSRYRTIILPQAQIAINLGFDSGWRYGGH